MRRNRVVLSTIAASLVLAGTAAAQMKEYQKTHFGVLAGATFARLHGVDAQALGDIKNKVGIAAGVFATIGLAKNVALEPEVLFAMKGAKITDGADKTTAKINYIQIPLLIKFRFPSSGVVSPHFYAGPQVGFKLSCKQTGTSGSVTVTVDCDAPGNDSKVKSTDFSLVTGGGVDVGRAIIDVRYDWGVSRIVTPTSGNSEDIKNRALYFLVGWTFRSPR